MPSTLARKRTRARRLALQFLYQVDLLGGPEKAETVEAFLDRALGEAPDVDVRRWARERMAGVLAQRDRIDETLAATALHWRIDRMAVVDRNVLRLAAWELRFADDVPRNVAIDEAVELARYFSCEESAAFVNGILDHLDNIASPVP